MNKIVINGVTVEVPDGANVEVVNNTVRVNGQGVNVQFTNELKIDVNGGLISLKTDRGSVTVNGNVANGIEAGGSIQCGNVVGNVNGGGSVTCGDVEGDVTAGGSVKCGNIGGRVNAGGLVKCSNISGGLSM